MPRHGVGLNELLGYSRQNLATGVLEFFAGYALSNYFTNRRIEPSLICSYLRACRIDSCLMIVMQLGAVGADVDTIDPIRGIFFRKVFKKI